jgi:hypothetical protein
MTDEKKWADLLGKAGKIAQDIAAEVQKNAKSIGEMAKESAKTIQESDAYAKAKEAAESARDKVLEAAESASEKAQKMSATAKRLVGALDSAETDCQDRDAFVASVTALLPDVAPQLDAKAPALGFGYLAEVGAGVAGVTGVEILYVRPADGERAMLKVARMEGKSARLAVGASSNAYAVCLYGEPVILKSATKRRGADVEVIVASIGFFKVTSTMAAPDQRAGGWLAGLGAGLNIGIPILSDLTAFEIEEQIIEKITLTDVEVSALEAALTEAPDRSTRRKIAKAL